MCTSRSKKPRSLPFTGRFTFTFFAGNWWICLHGWVPAFPVNPLWSISVKEQFYIAIPIIALCGRRFGVKTVSLVLIAVSYVAVVFYAMHPANGFSSQWTNSFVQFQFFAAGTLLSLHLKGRVVQWNPFLRLVAAMVSVSCCLVASIAFGVQVDTLHSTVVQAPIGWALVLAGTLLLFLSVLGLPPKRPGTILRIMFDRGVSCFIVDDASRTGRLDWQSMTTPTVLSA